MQAQKADDVKTIPEEHSETEQERKKALEDMKWKKEMEERVQEILESVKACEKKIEETTKEICRRGNTTGNETRSDK